MKIAQITVLLLFPLCMNQQTCADTRGTPESIAVQNIRMAMESYQRSSGQPATNWDQIAEFLDVTKMNQQDLIGSPAYPIQEHYVFIHRGIPMLGYEEGNAVLVRSTPVTNVSGMAGRYIISRNGTQLRFNWLSEDKVQQMLAAAGITELPKPEPWTPPVGGADNPAVTASPPQSSTPATPNAAVSNRPDMQRTAPPQASGPAIEISNETPAIPQPEQRTTDRSVAKWPVIVLAAVVGLVFAFVLLKKK